MSKKEGIVGYIRYSHDEQLNNEIHISIMLTAGGNGLFYVAI